MSCLKNDLILKSSACCKSFVYFLLTADLQLRLHVRSVPVADASVEPTFFLITQRSMTEGLVVE